MNRPMRKLIAFSAAAAMLANVPLMGASAKYVAEQVTDKEFESMVQFPDRNVYIENGTAKEFDADQQLVVVGTDGTTKLISLNEGIAGAVGYAATTMGIYDFIMPTTAEYGFDFCDPTYRFSLSKGTMIIAMTDRDVLVDAEGTKIAEYHAIRPISGGYYEVFTLEGGVGVINADGKVIIAPSADIFCVYLTADGSHFFVDGKGKDYFTDLTGKTVSAEYSELKFYSYSDYYGLSLTGDVPAADVTDYRLTSSLFTMKKDEKYTVVGGSKFEVITDYFDSVEFDFYGSNYAFIGKNKLLDENGNEIPYKYSYTYFDENGKIVREYVDLVYTDVYASTTLSYGEGGNDCYTYLLRKKEGGYSYEFDQLLDTNMNVLLEGDNITRLSGGVCVENGGKYTVYNAKLKKIGVFNNAFYGARGIQIGAGEVHIGVTDDKCTVYDKYLNVLIDDLPSSFTSASSITKGDYNNPEVTGYVVSGTESVQLYDLDCKLIKSKALAEGQTFKITDSNDIFVYERGYTADPAGDNFYLYKEGETTGKVVDISGKTIAEVPAALKVLPNGCFFESKDGVLTFYDKTGKELRKFNTSYNFTELSYGDYRDVSDSVDLSNIIMNDKDETTGKLTTNIYDLNTNTVRFTQTGKYDKVEAAGFDLIKTTVYPEGYATTTQSSYSYDDGNLWTNDSGFLTGMLTTDGTEVIAPTSGITLGTSQYCFGGYSRPDYRDFAIDTIYNDGVEYPEYFANDPYYVPAVENPDVDCYIVVNGVYIPKKDFAADYAKKNGFTIAVTTQYGCYVVLKDGKWALADSEGKLLCDAKYDRICEFADGLAWAEQWEEVTLVAEYEQYVRSLGRYVEEGEEYTAKVRKIGIITKDGKELVSPYYDLRSDSNHYNTERFGNTYYTYKTVDAKSGKFDFGIYKGTEVFNDFTAKYGYDTAAQYGDLWLVSKNGLKGIVTADNEVVLPVEFAEILYVPASEKITLNRQTEDMKAALTDQHYSSPISELGDGSKLVNVRTSEGRIKAYQIRDVEETTTSTTATTTSATTTTTTSATTTTSVPTTTTSATTTTTVPTTTTTLATTTITSVSTTTTTSEATITTTTSASITTTTSEAATEATTTSATTTADTTTEPVTTTTIAPDSVVGTWRFVKTLDADGTEVVNTSDMEAIIELREDNSGTLQATSDSGHQEYDIKWRKEGNKVIISTTEPNEDVMTLIYDSEKHMLAAPESDSEDARTAYFKKDGELPLGDVNGDDKVDAKDASAILVEYSKMSTGGDGEMTAAQKSAADVNGDDKVDAKDASSILAYYALVSTASGDIPSMKEFMTPKQT